MRKKLRTVRLHYPRPKFLELKVKRLNMILWIAVMLNETFGENLNGIRLFARSPNLGARYLVEDEVRFGLYAAVHPAHGKSIVLFRSAAS